jgi:hypothetical protein
MQRPFVPGVQSACFMQSLVEFGSTGSAGAKTPTQELACGRCVAGSRGLTMVLVFPPELPPEPLLPPVLLVPPHPPLPAMAVVKEVAPPCLLVPPELVIPPWPPFLDEDVTLEPAESVTPPGLVLLAPPWALLPADAVAPPGLLVLGESVLPPWLLVPTALLSPPLLPPVAIPASLRELDADIPVFPQPPTATMKAAPRISARYRFDLDIVMPNIIPPPASGHVRSRP